MAVNEARICVFLCRMSTLNIQIIFFFNIIENLVNIVGANIHAKNSKLSLASLGKLMYGHCSYSFDRPM